MIKKTIKGFLWIILLLLLIVLGVVGYAAGTNHGLKQILGLGEKYAPGSLAWGNADGRLLGPLNIEDFSYKQDDGLSVALASVQLEWSPKQLFSGTLQIEKLHTVDLELHLPKPTDNPDTEKTSEQVILPDIRLPIAIELQDIDLKDIRIYTYAAEAPIQINRVALVGDARGDTLQVIELNLIVPEAELAVKGLIQPIDNYSMDIGLNWRFKHPEFGDFSGIGTVKGDLEALELKHAVTGPVKVNLETQLLTVLDNPNWEVAATAFTGDIGSFVPTMRGTPINVNVSSKGTLDEFTALADLDTDLRETGPLNLKLDAVGNTQKITINSLLVNLLARPGKISLAGDVDIVKQAVDVKGRWESLGWPLVDQAVIETPEGNLSVVGNADDFEANLVVKLKSEQVGLIDTELSASGNQDIVRLSKLSITSPNSDIDLNAVATFAVAEQRFDAEGNWKALAWPLHGEAIATSPSGNFKLDGLASDYKFLLETNVQGKDIPASSWKVSGNGDDKHLDKFSIDGKLLDGELTLVGTAAWLPRPEWAVNLNGNKLNPGVKWVEVPGELAFDINSQGFIDDTGPQLDAIINTLRGELKQQKINGQGKLRLAGQELSVERLDLNSGQSKLAANGVIGKKWDLDWVLSSPDLSALVPDIKGGLSAKGKLSGSAEKPRANATLSLSDLDALGNKIKSLEGDLDIDISGNKQSSLSLLGKQLHFSGQDWNDLKLVANGRPEKHNLKINLNGPLANVSTAIQGGLLNEQWSGFLTELSALKTEFGDWKLKQKATINAAAEKAGAQDICLVSKPSEICISGDWDEKKGSSGLIRISQIRPERFSQYMPEGINIDTALSGTIDGKVNAAGQPEANVDLKLASGALTLQADSEPIEIALGTSTITSQLIGDKADSVIKLDLGKIGNVQSNMSILELSKGPRLDGNVNVALSDLSIITNFAPQLQEIKGKFSSDLVLKGKLDAPTIVGNISLLDFATEIPEFALNIKDTHFVAKSSDAGPLLLEGESHSGDGQVIITGSLDPKTRALTLNITGEDFQLANSNQIKALISPALDIKMNSDGMSVKGEVNIPSAYINANGGSDGIKTVSSSGDVVIIEDDSAPIEEKPSSKLNLEVRVNLSDDVKVEAGDFRGALSGSLLVEQTPELAPRGTGTIEVENGDYVIYGQQLNMQRGRILFGGGPIDNPQLDMDVARNVEAYEVVAGAKIRGTAQAPQLQLYSEPSMPDASILSYMLLGQPPGTKGGTYTLGKYLTPDLYVSYGIGLFNAINTFNMRYKLTDAFALQAASSTASSADLIYTIEK